MTSTDTDGHPDVAEISDLTEGLLPATRTADIRRHLDACALCADVYASLEEIRGMLGTLPGPIQMPAEVAGRIDAALAAEALLNATAPDALETSGATAASDVSPPSMPDSPVEQPDGTTARSAGTGQPAHVSRETVAAGRPAGHARAATGPGRKNRQRSGRRIAVLGTAFTVAALGIGSVLFSVMDNDTPSGGTAHGRQSSPADTFAADELKGQVATLLSSPDSNEPKILKEPAVPTCVREGIGRNDMALAAEEGTFHGAKAMLVVLPDPSDASRVTAYIVEATCMDQPSASDKAKVLLKESYPRS